MPEIVTLTTAVTHPSTTVVRFEKMILNVENLSIYVSWLDNNQGAGSAYYPTPAVLNPLGVLQPSGAALLTALNSANLSANSLVHRTLTQLLTDGYLAAGTVSGTAS